MKKYEQIEHTGDIGIRVFGQTRKQLFEYAAFALFDLMTKINTVNPLQKRIIKIYATDFEELFVNWLSELNFIFQTEYQLFCEFEITDLTNTFLRALISGEPLDSNRHEILNEIKAITFHALKIEKSVKGNWIAQVIFDI